MNSTRRNGSSTWLTLAMAGCTVPFTASFAADSVRDLEEIIVTAQKREQTLSEIPMSIQALEGRELERLGVSDVSDLITTIPGASMGRSLSASARSYQIRGVAGYYGDATVGYYIDDAIFTILNRNFGPNVNAFDLERVEVLRGPQGTLYGSGAMGGTLRFITADPDLEEFQARGNAGYSFTDDEGQNSDDNYYGNFAVSVPLIEGKLAVRASGSYELQGGYAGQAPVPRVPSPPFPSPQPVSFPGLLNEIEQTNYRLKVLAQPTDEFTAKLTFQRNNTKDPLGRQMATIDPASYYPSALNGVPVEPYAETEYDMFGLFMSYDFGFASLESSSGYLDRTAKASTPIFIPLPAREVPIGWTTGDSDTLSSELRLVSQSEGPLNWLVGGIYQDATAREDIDAQYFGVRPPGLCQGVPVPMLPGPPSIGPCTFRNDETQYDSKSYALFGEVSYELFDGKLIPLIGLRHFEDDRRFRNRVPQDAPTPILDTDTLAGDPGKFDSTDGRFNLSWFPTDGVMLYTNIASGFRSGTFNSTDGINAARLSTPSVTVGYAVEPDQLWSYELGTKLTFNNVSLELAAYYIDWTDVQLNFSGFNNVQYIANAGDVIGEGIEYGVNWQIMPSLLLQLTGNINSTEIDALSPGFPQSATIRIGEQVPSVPEQTHRVAVYYQRPIGTSGLDFTFTGSYSFTDEQGDVSDTQLGRLGESQELVSARIGVQGEKWGVRLVGDNLLKEKDAIQISGSGSMRAYPLTYGLELSYDF